MTAETIALLQQSIRKAVRLTRPDGEVIVARITLVDVLDEEIVFDMLSTTDESKYEKFDRKPAYLLYFSDISTVSAVPDSTS
ncbi:MAG: hypothetical protein WA254_04535 [Candidatus Sulfotelmatobacter sp.]